MSLASFLVGAVKPSGSCGLFQERGMRTRTAAIVLVAGLTASAAWAGQDERKNLQVMRDISRQVTGYTRFTIFDDVDAQVDKGVVTLTGKVTMPYKRNDIERRIAKIEGVSEVHNKIEVLPVSSYDDQLRFRIARAIYGNSTFWRYASMANPPIHIVVNRGHVRLTGVVNSEVERMLARSLATQFGAFSVTNDLKTDAEMRELLEKLD
jgi:osmotically-inducible protein OsmY